MPQVAPVALVALGISWPCIWDCNDLKRRAVETVEIKVKTKNRVGLKHVGLAFDRSHPELDSSNTAD